MISIRYLTNAARQNLTVIGIALFSAQSQADTVAPVTPGVSTGSMLQTGLSLLFVIGLLFLAAYLLRRFGSGYGFGKTGPMKIVGGLMISARERIVLVEVGDTWIVVGIVPGQIKTLHTLPKGELPVANNMEKPFGQWLKQMTERNNEKQ